MGNTAKIVPDHADNREQIAIPGRKNLAKKIIKELYTHVCAYMCINNIYTL